MATAVLMSAECEINGLTLHTDGRTSFIDVYGNCVMLPEEFGHVYVPPVTWSRGKKGVLHGIADNGHTVRLWFANGSWWKEEAPLMPVCEDLPKPVQRFHTRWRKAYLGEEGEGNGFLFYSSGECVIAGSFIDKNAAVNVTLGGGVRIVHHEGRIWVFDERSDVRLILKKEKGGLPFSGHHWFWYVPEICPGPTPNKPAIAWVNLLLVLLAVVVIVASFFIFPGLFLLLFLGGARLFNTDNVLYDYDSPRVILDATDA